MPAIHRVLLIRHQQAADKTAANLSARAHKSEIVPLTQIVALKNVKPDGRFDGIILTSPLAPGQFCNHPQFEEIRKLPVFCVGSFTAKRAEQAGFKTVSEVGSDARQLAERLSQTNSNSHFLYPCAKNRSFDFAKFLNATGRSCKNWEIYENKLLSPDPEILSTALNNSNAVFLLSKRTAEHFFSLTDQMLSAKSCPRHNFVAISQHVASAIPRKWQSATYIADEKSEKSMIDCLESIEC